QVEHHAPGHATFGDHLGGGVQRVDHRAVGPARPARCAVQARERGRVAAQESARVRPGWNRRAVPRYLADRPAGPSHPGNWVIAMTSNLMTSNPVTSNQEQQPAAASSALQPRVILRQTMAGLRLLLLLTLLLG